MRRAHVRRLMIAVGPPLSLLSLAVACNTVAGVDLSYEGSDDGGADDATGIDLGDGADARDSGRIVRDSSFDAPDGQPRTSDATASPTLPCNGDSDFDADADAEAECDERAGLGCCILRGAVSRCISFLERADACAGGLFIACRQDDPNTESACCWRSDAIGRFTALGGSCGSDKHACLVDGGAPCASGTCAARACAIGGGSSFEIGTCGTPAVECP